MRDGLGLEVAVDRFVDELTPLLADILASVEGRDPSTAELDVTTEAFELVCACIDADELATDPELWALLAIFGPRVDLPLLRSTPTAIRDARWLRGRSAWLHRPSTMFEIFCGVDARDAGARATVYYHHAMRVAYLVAAVDSHPGRTELLAIERYRGVLLRAMTAHGLSGPRHGGPITTPAGVGTGPPGPGGVDRRDGAEGGRRRHDGHRSAPDTADDRDDAAEGATGEVEEPEDLPPARPLEELYEELDALVGLQSVKEEIRLVAALTQVQVLRAERGLPSLDTSRHLVFTGNPGTGKTTVARLLAEIYRTLGVVERGQLVEVDRAGLVAGFVGQTAQKVTEVFDRADGGILLVDEAYALLRGSESDFGREAIDTIVKLTEDRRDRVVVILAGYPEEMAALVAANPGMRSRFGRTIEFPDYTTEELVDVFSTICVRHRYEPGPGVLEAVRTWIEAQPRGPGFGNGRLVRNLFEEAVARHARRVVEVAEPTDEHLVTLDLEDLPEVDPTLG
ncbi:MAG: AAA family ATPase [Acidimicrobiia bacterium]|nr:AAA family ATPase [Acidimicrobiia bacterium]